MSETVDGTRPKARWRPTYTLPGGIVYTVPSVDIQECPVSFIGDGVAELVHDLEMARTVHSAYGAPILTEPFLEWPVKMAEALDILEQERRADEYHAWKASQKRD